MTADHSTSSSVAEITRFDDYLIAWYRLAVLGVAMLLSVLHDRVWPTVGQVALVIAATAYAVALVALTYRKRVLPVRAGALSASADYLALTMGSVLAPNVTGPMLPFLPVLTILVGIRFGYRAFLLGMSASAMAVFAGMATNAGVSAQTYHLTALVTCVAVPLLVDQLVRHSRSITERLERANAAKTEFLATMSHELRMPLANIVGYVPVLLDEASPDRARAGEAVLTNVKVLRTAVDNVIDLAGIEAGHINLRSRPFSFNEILSDVRTVMEPERAAKGLTLGFRTQGVEAEDCWLGDGARVHQVVANLVSNALHYTMRGYVQVTLQVKSLALDRASVTIVVTDTGAGVPEAEKLRIFEKFYQASRGSNRSHGGAGLGLAICSRINEAMAGQLFVRDNPGGGAVFTWSFQVKKADRSACERRPDISRELQALDQHAAQVRSVRVLVVDDSKDIRALLVKKLQRAGHHVSEASDGAAALLLLRSREFEVVVLDLHMPVTSGWEVMEEMRRDHGLFDPPAIIVSSADVSATAIATATELGAIAFLGKPVGIAELLEAIRAVVEGRPVQAVAVEPGVESETHYVEVMRSLTTASEFVEFIHHYQDFLDQGREGLLAAMRALDVHAVREVTHSLHGEAPYFGAKHVAKLAARLNRECHEGGAIELMVEELVLAIDQARAEVARLWAAPASLPREGGGAIGQVSDEPRQ